MYCFYLRIVPAPALLTSMLSRRCSLPHISPRHRVPPGNYMALSSSEWANCISQTGFKVRSLFALAPGLVQRDTRPATAPVIFVLIMLLSLCLV